jgi:hypothetical protein
MITWNQETRQQFSDGAAKGYDDAAAGVDHRKNDPEDPFDIGYIIGHRNFQIIKSQGIEVGDEKEGA